MKKMVALGLLFASLSFCAEGCSPQWRKKFIRRSKDVVAPQPILVLQSEQQATYPPDVRYREHFAYWKSWHSELVNSLGNMRKRDLVNLSGVIGELRSLQELLKGPPADRLREILEELTPLQQAWSKDSGSLYAPAAMRSRLQQLQREIDKKFHYSKVKQCLPPGQSSSPKP